MNPAKIFGLSLVAGVLAFSAPAFAESKDDVYTKAKSETERTIRIFYRDFMISVQHLVPDSFKAKHLTELINEMYVAHAKEINGKPCKDQAQASDLKDYFVKTVYGYITNHVSYKIEGDFKCGRDHKLTSTIKYKDAKLIKNP